MFKDMLRTLRIKAGMNQEELAKKIGCAKSTISMYENGAREPNFETLEAIADIFNVDMSTLIDRKQSQNQNNSITILPSNKIFMRPLYDSVAAGIGAVADNTILTYIPTFISNSMEKDMYIWVNVQGDSMSPLIDDGSKILIRMQDSVDSGQIAVILIDNEEAVVKKVEYGTDYVTLISINPYYPPRCFEGKEVLRLRVVGLVKEVSKELQ